MAKTLAAFPSENESVKRNRYPWDKWLDGQVWELRKGSPDEVKAQDADFHVTPKSFESAVKQAVATREGDVRVAPLRDEQGERTGLVIQFIASTEAPTATDTPAE